MSISIGASYIINLWRVRNYCLHSSPHISLALLASNKYGCLLRLVVIWLTVVTVVVSLRSYIRLIVGLLKLYELPDGIHNPPPGYHGQYWASCYHGLCCQKQGQQPCLSLPDLVRHFQCSFSALHHSNSTCSITIILNCLKGLSFKLLHTFSWYLEWIMSWLDML